ncbi:RNA polymerase sigma factor [Rubripirellula amarantea]|uniref:RNA polymerase sigma factor n=2 Tax=Rubripirellula amarantea TaxID=2527999 RepID=A0A5C5WUZ2_9BACT|nr:RNA polymerase sigma factor [Rubripirellula amarantea]
MPDPETRASLLLKIRDPQDATAWREFSAMYRPVVERMAQLRGMQPADADDLAQQVLLAIANAIERFEPDDDRAKFRTWLRTIARRAIINAMTRGVPDRGAGGSEMIGLLHEQPAPDAMTETLDLEYRREIFRVAADQIRNDFHDDTWNAFWQTTVEGIDVDQVAKQLGRSRGSVYTARSRVMLRLKQKVQELDMGLNS